MGEEIIGKKILVNMGSMVGKRRECRWKIGEVKKRYGNWYLVDFGVYVSGIYRMDMHIIGGEKEGEEDEC